MVLCSYACGKDITLVTNVIIRMEHVDKTLLALFVTNTVQEDVDNIYLKEAALKHISIHCADGRTAFEQLAIEQKIQTTAKQVHKV